MVSPNWKVCWLTKHQVARFRGSNSVIRSLFFSLSFPFSSVSYLWFFFLFWFYSRIGCLHVVTRMTPKVQTLTSSVSLSSGKEETPLLVSDQSLDKGGVFLSVSHAPSWASDHFGWKQATLRGRMPNPVFWEGGSCDGKGALCWTSGITKNRPKGGRRSQNTCSSYSVSLVHALIAAVCLLKTVLQWPSLPFQGQLQTVRSL